MSTLFSLLTGVRRRLHTYPELSFMENRTTDFIEETLKSWNIPFFRFEQLKTGGYCDIGEGKLVAFRADIDALPIQENAVHTVKSQTNGIMHACGHDYHTAIGLGLAKYFSEHPEKLIPFKLRIFFQPGEEAAPGGAEKVVEESSWNNVALILGVHVAPNNPVGNVYLFDGPVQASSTSLSIEIHGPGGHTSKPEETLDLIRLASIYVNQLQTMLQETIAAHEKLVFAFGSVQGGSTHNIIPQQVRLRGSFRTLNNDVLKKTIQAIRTFTTAFDQTYSTKSQVEFPTNCPATINNSALYQHFADYMNRSGYSDFVIRPETPSMGADDFAFYARQVPGLYLIIGGGGTGTLHSGDLELDESLIEPALSYLTGFIAQLKLDTIL